MVSSGDVKRCDSVRAMHEFLVAIQEQTWSIACRSTWLHRALTREAGCQGKKFPERAKPPSTTTVFLGGQLTILVQAGAVFEDGGIAHFIAIIPAANQSSQTWSYLGALHF